MPLKNRVTPLGDLIATPERGLVYGNRGCLHNKGGEIRRRYSTKRWIACRLSFRGRRRSPLMAPGRFTELFFLDEVTALAAGHRPCAECRRDDYDCFKAFWAALHPGQSGADAIDAQLHDERIVPASGRRRLHDVPVESLPDGAFVLHENEPCLVLGSELLNWSPAGYLTRRPAAAERPTKVITPPSLVELLRRGWNPLVPLVHPTAFATSRAAGARAPARYESGD